MREGAREREFNKCLVSITKNLFPSNNHISVCERASKGSRSKNNSRTYNHLAKQPWILRNTYIIILLVYNIQ